MESIQLIRERIQGIETTLQITQSMRLVSTAKVQKANEKMEANRLFREQSFLLAQTSAYNLKDTRHPYLKARPVKKTAVIVIGGDRGLCGGYNVNVGKKSMALIKSVGDVKIITIGVKARDFCRRRFASSIAHSYIGMSENPFFEDAADIGAIVLDWYDNKEVDQIYMVYTEFETMLSQTPKAVKLLPMEPAEDIEASAKKMYFEPGGAEQLRRVIPFYISASIYGAILESAACEQSARIASMDSAVRNASEMIESLTLQYNQARQEQITQEIIEIVSGANAV